MAFEDELAAMNAMTSAPSTESASTDAPGTDAPSTSTPSTEAPTTEVPDELSQIKSKLQEYEDNNRILREEIDKIKKPSTKAPSTEVPVEDVNFLSDDTDLDDLITDKDKLNALLNQVYKAGIRSSRNISVEEVLRSIPAIVKTNIETTMALKSISDNFFNENEDLLPHRKELATAYEKLAAEHPDWKVEDVIKESGMIVRDKLKLTKQVNNKDKQKPNLPPGTKSGRTTGKQEVKKTANNLLAEIDAMNTIN